MDDNTPDYLISKVDLSKSVLRARSSMAGIVDRLKDIVESSYLKKDHARMNPVVPSHRKPKNSD